MKSKIVRQLETMLIAGAMLVTSGNVTTYAAEQTDESVEVEETQEFVKSFYVEKKNM